MSSQVGSGHIAIFPVMTGFKSAVVKGTRDAGAAGARTFEGGFKGAGARTGRGLGRDMKSALNAQTGDLGAAAMKTLNRNVATAAAALSKARLKQQDDAGRVRVAEVRLQEAIARSGAESSVAIAAAERLASARRAQQASTDAAATAAGRLQAAQSAVAAATSTVSAVTAGSAGSVTRLVASLRAGYSDARAGVSAFTGVAGSLGGIAKEVVILARNTKLGAWASLQAQQVSKQFTSLASMVGGGIAKAVTTTRARLGDVSGYVRSAFAPMGQYAAAAGTRIVSPFMQLGRRVSSYLAPVTAQVRGLFSGLGAVGATGAGRLAASFASGVSRIGGAASTALSSVVSAASRAGTAAGQALGSALTNTATAGVAAAGAAIGVALGSGLSRLSSIDTARAKLVGLGNDGTTVAQIMGDATASVRGTSFGLGEAATVAASAVAAGIKPGEALQGHLKSIANNAAAAGLSMQDMGSIFNKAATQANGVQNDVISQLADKGIPIYQALADQMGVTAGEVFKLASEGKVDFKTFSAAATAAAGTVADEIGKTVPGAWKNMLASLGRSGAGIFGGINRETGEMYGLFARIAPLLQAITSAMAPLEERAAGIGQALDTMLGPGIQRVTDFFTKLGEGTGLAGTALEGFSGILGPLGGAMAALGAGGVASLLAKLGPLGALVPGLGGALAALASPLGIAAAAFAGFALTGGDAGALVSSVTGIIDQVVEALPGIVAQVAEFIPQLVESLLSQVPALLAAAVQIVSALVAGLVTATPMLIDGAVQLVDGLLAAVLANLPMIIEGAVQLVSALVEGIIVALPLLVEGALQLVSGLLAAIVASLPMIIQGGIQLLLALVTGLIDSLPVLLTGVQQLISGLLLAIVENLPLLIEAGIQLLISLVTGLIDALPQLVTAAVELVLQLVAGLLSALPQLIEAGIQLVVALIVGLVEAIPQIIETLPQIVSAIWDGLMGVNWLDLGVQIVMGIINGLASMGQALLDAIVSLASSAFDGFKDFFGIKSPARKMIQPGRDIVRGAVVGVDRQADDLGDSLVEMAKSAAARTERAMGSVSATVATSAEVNGSAASAGVVGREVVVEQHNQFAHMDPEVAVELSKQRLAFVVGNAG